MRTPSRRALEGWTAKAAATLATLTKHLGPVELVSVTPPRKQTRRRATPRDAMSAPGPIWAADPHVYGPGDAWWTTWPRKRCAGRSHARRATRQVGTATCRICLNAVATREERARAEAAYDARRLEAQERDQAWWDRYTRYLPRSSGCRSARW
jgi:hypothetical protein